MAVGELLILVGIGIIVLGMLFGGRSRGSIRLGPFSGTGTIGFLIVALGVLVYLLEQGLLGSLLS